MLWIQRHNRLFPRLCLPVPKTVPSWFAVTRLRADLRHLNIKQALHRLPDIDLGRQRVDFKRILIVAVRTPHPLLGDQRPQDNLMGLEDQLGLLALLDNLLCVALHPMILTVTVLRDFNRIQFSVQVEPLSRPKTET